MHAAKRFHFVIIGGGVAAITCADELCVSGRTDVHVTLISSSPSVKSVATFERLGKFLARVEIAEVDLATHSGSSAARANLTVLHADVARVDVVNKRVLLRGGASHVPFDKVCICTGAAPRRILDHPLVVGLRDTETVEHLAAVMRSARRAVLVGNGGIAVGLVQDIIAKSAATASSTVRFPPLVWVTRNHYIGSTFFDSSASDFLLSRLPLTVVHRVNQRSGSLSTTSIRRDSVEHDVYEMDANSENDMHVHFGHCCGENEADLVSQALAAEVASASRTDTSGAARHQQPSPVPVEIIPTYAPLPPRAKRARTRHGAQRLSAPAVHGVGVSTGSSVDAGIDADFNVDARGTAVCPTESISCTPGDSSVALHPNQQHPLPAPSVDNSTGGIRHGSGVGPLFSISAALRAVQCKVSEPPAPVAKEALIAVDEQLNEHTEPRVRVEHQCEIIQIRGTLGTCGAVGVLADGRWHDARNGMVRTSAAAATVVADSVLIASTCAAAAVAAAANSTTAAAANTTTAAAAAAAANTIAPTGASLSSDTSDCSCEHHQRLSRIVAADVSDAAAGVDAGTPVTDVGGDAGVSVAGTSGGVQLVTPPPPFPLRVRLSNGAEYDADVIISATGVEPATGTLLSPMRDVSRRDATRLFNGGTINKRTASSAAAAHLTPGCCTSTSAVAHSHSTPGVTTPFLRLSEGDGGLLVNAMMQTSGSPDVFAAGDVAAVLWPRFPRFGLTHAGESAEAMCEVDGDSDDDHHHHSSGHHFDDGAHGGSAVDFPPLWFQMRTWGQARSTGMYAAHCMLATLDNDAQTTASIASPINGHNFVTTATTVIAAPCPTAATTAVAATTPALSHWASSPPLAHASCGAFALFSHVTSAMGHRVVLLGLFNGQGLGKHYERAVRHIAVTGVNAEPSGTVSTSSSSTSPPLSVAATMAAVTAACVDEVLTTVHGHERDSNTTSSSTTAVHATTSLQHTTAPPQQLASTPPSSSPLQLRATHTESAVQVQVRVTPGVEYVKLVLLRGRVVGAMLIGDTGLDETLENLIMSGTRVMASRSKGAAATAAGASSSSTGPVVNGQHDLLDLLHANIDVEDYFD